VCVKITVGMNNLFLAGDLVKVISPWRLESWVHLNTRYDDNVVIHVEPGTIGIVLEITPVTLWTRVLFVVYGARWIRGSGNLFVLSLQ